MATHSIEKFTAFPKLYLIKLADSFKQTFVLGIISKNYLI